MKYDGFHHTEVYRTAGTVCELFEQEIEMTKNIYVALFVLIMIAVVVSVDLLFFRN